MNSFIRTNALLLCAALMFAAGPANAGREPITVSDVINIESASQFDISPDGAKIVWVKRTSDMKKNKYVTTIMLTFLSDTTTIPITRGPNGDSSPLFSPDGSTIAFLRDPDKGPRQVYLYAVRGGEPEKLTGAGAGVRSFEWRDDTTILFTAPEDSTFREHTLARKKDNTVVAADQEHYKPVRLFSISLGSKETARVTVNQGAITEFAVSPCGRWVVTAENQDIDYRYDHRVRPKQFLIDMENGGRTEIFTGAYEDPFDFQWAHDGGGFYCRKAHASNPKDDYVSINHLFFYSLESRSLIRVDADWENGAGYAYRVVRDGVAVMCANGTADRVAFYANDAGVFSPRVLQSPSHKPMSLSGSARGGNRIIYGVSNASAIPEFMTACIEDGALRDERKFIELNEPLKKKALARSELISWRGARGDRVEGMLYYPVPYDETARYPLITCLHGGPSGVDRDFFSERWSNYPHLLAARGAFVLKVNYHGSGNYGLAWLESIKGNYYDLEVPDILNGIDHVIKQGRVDQRRLGIMGWSNGSILAIECSLRDGRFKALCAGAGDVNWSSDYGNCAFGAAFDNAYFGGPPWELPQEYIKKSPLFRMQRLKTPTLIMHGEKDTSVPTEQGWQHFRAMQQIGTTPVRFLLFPGTGHGLQKLSHQKRKMEEELAWFDRYLFLRPAEPNEAIDENSPLALALARAAAAKAGVSFGAIVNGTLVPEAVAFKEMSVGRFEVTRAQYRAFDPGYTCEPGTDNFPANGITFEQARAYCEWLSGITGTTWRLPSGAEMEKLLAASRSNAPYENNFERWAGYDTTPEERSLLADAVAKLETSRLLIEAVGSFKPVDGIYDLCGNVAEWIDTGDGEGAIRGLSAVSTRDGRTPYAPPPLSYVGFRVVEEFPDK